MKRTPYSPACQPLTLAEEDELANEGAPRPGVVGADVPHRRSTCYGSEILPMGSSGIGEMNALFEELERK